MAKATCRHMACGLSQISLKFAQPSATQNVRFSSCSSADVLTYHWVLSSSSVYSDFEDESPAPSPESTDPSSYSESDMDVSEFDAREPSIFSYSSSRNGRDFLRESDGRVFNAQSDVYFLPAGTYVRGTLSRRRRLYARILTLVYSDEVEFDRL
ncbi:uncharacterized protein EI90DRAFT_1567534 [Cantharellus anzutake]|uniref:uncharacterized protein n=1 Tax=Cantharellus anzutake TaxID=1750568 RepID=UPI001908E485|nr:uncharacterized protein EI90DRAFT_1567534 [Cantharellus anzutake]KAF8328372.1 hypothetical protein EI90DRAFT_1567534 [Cantharellus anzutake]